MKLSVSACWESQNATQSEDSPMTTTSDDTSAELNAVFRTAPFSQMAPWNPSTS